VSYVKPSDCRRAPRLDSYLPQRGRLSEAELFRAHTRRTAPEAAERPETPDPYLSGRIHGEPVSYGRSGQKEGTA